MKLFIHLLLASLLALSLVACGQGSTDNGDGRRQRRATRGRANLQRHLFQNCRRAVSEHRHRGNGRPDALGR